LNDFCFSKGDEQSGMKRITVRLKSQTLTLFLGDRVTRTYNVSTAKNGAGELQDSECTPRGRHLIAAKIGGSYPTNSVFVGRVPTGEIFREEMKTLYPARDWILTRILWLEGLEVNLNRGAGRDSKNRYIYIHGTPDSTVLGAPGSRGCIRMRNDDVCELYEEVEIGTVVQINDS
jgi:L,D-transpeptidase YbiS